MVSRFLRTRITFTESVTKCLFSLGSDQNPIHDSFHTYLSIISQKNRIGQNLLFINSIPIYLLLPSYSLEVEGWITK
jgi:hypothetical protein